jgi:2-polyprenyl-3-methyl-5-hydroxy-6-metoxy-1,4-benzoquinol methylase
MQNSKLISLNRWGFYQLVDLPTEEELADYYSQQYFQTEGAYELAYDDDELLHIQDKLRLKYTLLFPFLPNDHKPSLLDIGCGEGYTLPFFSNMGWRVVGADHSDFALRQHNPGFLDSFELGAFPEVVRRLRSKSMQFDVIWLDNVLEHVRNPFSLLDECLHLAVSDGLLLVDVPNDYSRLQQCAVQNGLATDNFWVALPDHLSYFNIEGLKNIAAEAGWTLLRAVSDFPIDFNLFNPAANYAQNKHVGKDAHKQRKSLEHLFVEISEAKTLDVYEALAKMGIGRSIIAVFKKA